MKTLRPDDVTVSIGRVDAAEVDEMWSFVGSKREPRWLWHAIDQAQCQHYCYEVQSRPVKTAQKGSPIARFS